MSSWGPLFLKGVTPKKRASETSSEYFIRRHGELGLEVHEVCNQFHLISLHLSMLLWTELFRSICFQMIFRWFSRCGSLRYFHYVFATCAVEERLRTCADVLWDCPMAHRFYWVVCGEILWQVNKPESLGNHENFECPFIRCLLPDCFSKEAVKPCSTWDGTKTL